MVRIKRALRGIRRRGRPDAKAARQRAGKAPRQPAGPRTGPQWPQPPTPGRFDRLLRRTSPIQAMTRAEFSSLKERYPYYRGRAQYLSTAARLAADLIERERLRTALELGPHQRPIVTGADALELEERDLPEGARRLIVHDATVTPWPFRDRAYDLFVALQVFEHLGTRQREAFTEVCRVARHAIISLPIDWVLEDTTDMHHGITNERVLEWFAPRVPTRIVEGNPGPAARLIYVFEHLDRGQPRGPQVPPPVERPVPPPAKSPPADHV